MKMLVFSLALALCLSAKAEDHKKAAAGTKVAAMSFTDCCAKHDTKWCNAHTAEKTATCKAKGEDDADAEAGDADLGGTEE